MKETILCPACGWKAGEYDGKAKTTLEYRCKHCNKRVVFNPVNRKIEAKRIPDRKTSSGLRFY